jgi:hypothetical protein
LAKAKMATQNAALTNTKKEIFLQLSNSPASENKNIDKNKQRELMKFVNKRNFA